MELPDEIIDLILSYGDVVVTQRYHAVVRQLKYLEEEFSYQIKNPWSYHWRNKPRYYYPMYIFTKCNIKQQLSEDMNIVCPSETYLNLMFEHRVIHNRHIIYDFVYRNPNMEIEIIYST